MKRGKISGVGRIIPKAGCTLVSHERKMSPVKQRRRPTETREGAALVEGGGDSGLERGLAKPSTRSTDGNEFSIGIIRVPIPVM